MTVEQQHESYGRVGHSVALRPAEGGLLARLRRALAPRSREVLVMERDGRLVCARSARAGERAGPRQRSLG